MAAENSAAVDAAGHIHQLTSAMRRGDEAAFRQFHASYFDRLLRYLFVVARGDDEIARDALQETFTRVVRHVRPFDTEQALWSWITVLARSSAADTARKRRRYANLLERFTSFWQTQPVRQIDGSEQRLEELLMAALAALHSCDRELIEQKYFHGATVRELANQFGLTEKAVESRLMRTRRALRAELVRRLNDAKD